MGNCFRLTVHLPRMPRTTRLQRVRHKIPHTSSGKLQLGQRALAILLLLVISGMGIMYLVFVNVRVTKGFEIQSLEKKLIKLQQSQQELQIQAAQLQSIQSIEQSSAIQGYIPTHDARYLSSSGVALKGQ
ncbi:MAG: hypothetical protein A2722_02620 [Candidatus Doudnabacteria bacterium RIFCSPHIGHO2_01_FULL_50_11]|uniref:Cell division protein FtsL n=1 Tax=Candidatus Doudnabacteria bacterium RIFCSPHIGHO2_01_FULL_50_11 TaxID=1817828 RepID=A0A1F5PMB9_9BACT|nr:MAG: hypothetical protein A2722_02620 [Candidatus Doudnabacteria bacterium RIFCSPHIGHO2_01_FULL_50_11]